MSNRISALVPLVGIAFAMANVAGCPDNSCASNECVSASSSGSGGSVGMGGSGGGGGGEQGPWYDTELDPDFNYLPLGDVPYSVTNFAWQDPSNASADVDVYYPNTNGAPVVVFLPGVAIIAKRYTWIGNLLASHGVATAIVNRAGQFAFSTHTLVTLDELAKRNQDSASPLYQKLDLSRIVLGGHSQGASVQSGLTDVGTCPVGFCKPGAYTPDGIRGLLLLGFHNESEMPGGPMPAIEAPWLMLSGDRDGLATSGEIAATVQRIQDRPLYSFLIHGMNHFQFADYVDPKADIALGFDNEPTIGNKEARAQASKHILSFIDKHLLGKANIPFDLGVAMDAKVTADVRPAKLEDIPGHMLPRVGTEPFGQPGFDGNPNNVDVVATAEYGGSTYLLVRNDVDGASVWRFDGTNLSPVPFPAGATHGIYGNKLINGLLGAMTVFQGKLWVGFSSGTQGGIRGSTGAEIWTYDGTNWAPVVSRKADDDPEVTIASISGCADNDGDPTATIEITGLSMIPSAWKGAVLDDVDAGLADPHIFDVVDNSATGLTVSLNATANTAEFAVCNGLAPGQTMRLRIGLDESGFGETWNKAIASMGVLEGKLYVGTALEYDRGAQVYVTENGTDFSLLIPRQTFGVHPNGIPISSSVSSMHVSNVSGSPLLYFGLVGTQGYGGRLVALAPDGTYTFLIDDPIDANDTGPDEAGLGGGDQQVPSIATFNGRLWMTGFNTAGFSIVSTDNPFDPASFRIDVGTGMTPAQGFGLSSQVSAYLHVVGNELWATSFSLILAAGDLAENSGSGFRTANGTNWQLATAHAMGINAVGMTRVFEQSGVRYGVASRGGLSSKTSFGPLRMYALRDEKY